MCGIVGCFHYKKDALTSEAEINGMCDSLVHRGPNDKGTYVNQRIGIGMRRLSIIDVASGHQPIANEDKTIWIVFNGEIYNYKSLQEDLIKKGHAFQTSTDSETVLHSYEEKGIDCLQDLRGMFSFAIWDENRQELFIARDRLGIKPLYWCESNGSFYFASEMKALLAVKGIGDSIDWNAFDAYFAYNYIPAPLTIYADIRKLPAGHFLKIKLNSYKINRYWDIDFTEKYDYGSKQIEKDFIDLFSEAVDIHLMSEVPLGVFLSGGIDSGLVVAMINEIAPYPANTFTIGFGGVSGNFLDERPYANEIAERYHCKHHQKEVTPQIQSAVNAAITAFDEPFADDGLVPMYHICQEAAKEVTVVLTGLGGDENFGGYERYLGLWLSRYGSAIHQRVWQKMLSPIVNSLKEDKGGHYTVNHMKRFVNAQALWPPQRYLSYIQSLSAFERRNIYKREIAEMIDFEYVDFLGMKYFERLNKGDLLDRAVYQDFNMYLPEDILTLSDRIGMHFSLEARVPFIDHKVVEFCAKIPTKWKINMGRKKYLLKNAAKRYLPNSAINHRKQGFCSPLSSWLKHELRPEVQTILSDANIKKNGIFKPPTIKNLLDNHLSHRQLNDKTIFALYMFNKWFQKVDIKY